MYAVVGCRDCQALWVVEGRADTLTCPRCGSARKWSRRRKFHETSDATEARQARAALLAKRQDAGEAFANLDSYEEMETQLDDAGVDDAEYLDGSGLDTEAVAAAGERAESGAASGGGSRKETVLSALDTLDAPTEDAVVDYASERGVPADYTRDALAKLVRRGEVSESGGTYRRL